MLELTRYVAVLDQLERLKTKYDAFKEWMSCDSFGGVG